MSGSSLGSSAWPSFVARESGQPVAAGACGFEFGKSVIDIRDRVGATERKGLSETHRPATGAVIEMNVHAIIPMTRDISTRLR